jgi:hypothetical protein
MMRDYYGLGLLYDPAQIYPNKWRADMTLGQAIRSLKNPIVCACIGPPIPSPYGTPCWCRLGYGQANAIVYTAHILAKLLVDHRRKVFWSLIDVDFEA